MSEHPAPDRRYALSRRISYFTDLLASDPLPGATGDVAYELLVQAAAQIASDRLLVATLPDEIDLFRVIRRAGRKDIDKARAVARLIGTKEAQETTLENKPLTL